MKLSLYTDEVLLDKNKINNERSILYLNHFLGKLINQVVDAGICLEDAIYFYKRNKKGESILGIQIAEGDIENLTNYLVFECRSKLDNGEVKCISGFQVDEKHDDVLFKVPYTMPHEVIHFFKKIENLIKNPGERETEYDSMVSVHYNLHNKPQTQKTYK